ncbi:MULTISPECIES: HAD-IIB family hydrolase [Marinobacter]|jgi:mannosyl-3-phosphoglycerate phosphatase|uniref:HAD-IIB family hydrolase n=1 Tax=Marinobacter TaxID=2742 RepID=UPI000FCBEA90|nr:MULTISPECIES: HAD-IIB family hydrolase [Marinobacter]MBJ7277465.1 HAD-IIB family hydrolase [Marinobacter salarius]MDM8181469.1 HAD-IIB family hydrolase [Marinobacter salarius]RUT74136.1 HAD-IIB family hydrolase [Marinobacter sp. NP-6]
MAKPRLLLFSDLDGTLLDHDSYDWSPAKPALERLAAADIPVVLNSSKTAGEIHAVREQLGNTAPFIVENGAAVIVPANCFGPGPEQVQSFGASRDEVLTLLKECRAEGFQFRSFADMSPAELAGHAKLSEPEAKLAKDRAGTEPLLWEGDEDSLARFREKLDEHDCRLVQGGRFLHAMGTFDKADGVRFLLGKYREHFEQDRLIAIALGDSPNDQHMLEEADIAVIVRGVHSESVSLPSQSRAIRSIRAGPAGWNECVLNLLIEYGY